MIAAATAPDVDAKGPPAGRPTVAVAAIKAAAVRSGPMSTEVHLRLFLDLTMARPYPTVLRLLFGSYVSCGGNSQGSDEFPSAKRRGVLVTASVGSGNRPRARECCGRAFVMAKTC